MAIEPVTHLEKSIAGTVEPVTHLEKVIAEYGGGGGGGGEVTVDTELSPSSANPVRNSAIYAALEDKASKEDIADFITDADVSAEIAEAIGGITSFEYYLCGEGEYDPNTGVPTVQGADTNHIYLTPTSGTNLNMYAYINNTFTFLGTTEVDLDGYAKTENLKAVAFSGEYADLLHPPLIPAAVTVDQSITQGSSNPVESSALYREFEKKANSDDLKAVATSGSYNDLSNKPNLATVATSGSYNDLSNKPNLATVATSGSYNDLSNKPSIPVVPSNLTLGKRSGTNTQLTINIIDSGEPASGTPDTTITIVKG